MNRRTLLAAGAAMAALPAAAQPASRLIDARYTRFGAGDVDHGAWADLLSRHRVIGADGVARLRYGAMPLADVAAYVATLETVDPATLSSAAAFAYWVNLYNALTVRVILENWPVSSIRRIGVLGGPWRANRVRVAGRNLSLDDIEHGILRPIWQDARVHYAVNCASIGCPNLAERPYTAGRLAEMLDRGARDYVNHPRGARAEAGGLHVSSIYMWFKEDFGGTDAGVLSHLGQHAGRDLAGTLAQSPRITGDSYDWSINAA